MPKDKSEEPKKKVVIVEEVEVETTPDVEEKIVENKKEEKKAYIETSEEQVSQTISEDSFDENDKPNYLWIIVPTALLVGALVGGLITYFSGISKLNMPAVSPSPVSTIMPEATETPVASPSSNINKDTIKIQVLNGSGVSGAAAKAKALLEGLGYKNLDTGNASSSDVEVTEVAAKEASSGSVAQIIKDLSKSYSAVEASKPLSSTSKYDIVITLGKK